MQGLYAIVDTTQLARRGLDPLAFTEAVLDARPAAVQLRDKAGDASRTLALLRAMKPLAARAGVPLFANDRPDLALLAGASGVHLGQEDLPVAAARAAVRAVGATLSVGLSTHDAAQVEAALGEAAGDLAYLAVGPVFATASKERPAPVLGLAQLGRLAAHVRARRPGLPVVAIGGITLESAAQVLAHCDAIAVIGALLPDALGAAAYVEVRERARALRSACAAVTGPAVASPGERAP